MTLAQSEVQRCLENLRNMLSIPCPSCSMDDPPDGVPCYCFEDFGATARIELRAAKKARKIEKRQAKTP